MKRIVFALSALFMLLFACALSEENIYIPTEEGGVVARGSAAYRTRALIRELNVAYLDSDTPYLTKGVQTKFIVHASGGDGIYSYTFSIFRRQKTSGSLTFVASSGEIRSNTWYYTPSYDSGQYMLVIRVSDSAGSYIQWQSPVYESSTNASVQKAHSLAEQCKAAATTDYARALWLHDWLIMNANYDYTFTYYYPDGVLLHGTGVCQSYALAYKMLLELVGIECIYVTGEAGGGSHGWNLVKIGGNWYHVDCTWDDPGTGGSEHHRYFCVPDEVMMRDHTWRHETQIMPEATSGDLMYMLRSGADQCKTQDDVIRILNGAIADRLVYVEIWYTGDQDSFDFKAAFNAWFQQMKWPSDYVGSRYWAEETNLRVDFDFGKGWPDKSVPVKMAIDPSVDELDAGGSMHLLVMPVPSSADTGNLEWTSSNEDVVRVSNGYVTAVNPGVCVIRASHPGGAKAEITLYVRSHISLEIPSHVRFIEQEAFSGCVYLESVSVAPGVERIESKAFSGCPLLKTVSIPKSVGYIAPDAFSGCGRVVIECTDGSYAHSYAVSEGIEYRLVSKSP